MSGGRRHGAALYALAVLALACACAFLAGHTWLEAHAVRAGVTQALDRFEHPGADEVSALLADVGVDASELIDAGIDVESFAQHAFAGFAYEVENVSVDGGSAEVRLQVTGVDCQTLMAQLADDMAAHATDYDVVLLRPDGERELTEEYFTELCARLDEAAPVTSEVTIRFIRERGHWLLDASSEDDLVRALFGGPTA